MMLSFCEYISVCVCVWEQMNEQTNSVLTRVME